MPGIVPPARWCGPVCNSGAPRPFLQAGRTTERNGILRHRSAPRAWRTTRVHDTGLRIESPRHRESEALMTYDVEAVRSHFPALAQGAAHFDGPGGSQVPDVVAAAVGNALTTAIANRGQITAAERFADGVVVAARQAMGDLLGADPGGIVFGRSMTQLTFDFARTLAKTWRAGDE